jgi:hypothetical protein
MLNAIMIEVKYTMHESKYPVRERDTKETKFNLSLKIGDTGELNGNKQTYYAWHAGGLLPTSQPAPVPAMPSLPPHSQLRQMWERVRAWVSVCHDQSLPLPLLPWSN